MGSGVPIAAVMGGRISWTALIPAPLVALMQVTHLLCGIACNHQLYAGDQYQRAWRKVGNIVRKRFESFQLKYPSVVGEVRGLGAMLAFDVIKDGDDTIPNAELTKKIIDTCAERGLVVISAGVNNNVIRILSPLVIEETQLSKGLDILEK